MVSCAAFKNGAADEYFIILKDVKSTLSRKKIPKPHTSDFFKCAFCALFLLWRGMKWDSSKHGILSLTDEL